VRFICTNFNQVFLPGGFLQKLFLQPFDLGKIGGNACLDRPFPKQPRAEGMDRPGEDLLNFF